MNKERLDLIETLIKIHDEGVRVEGGGSSSDAWGPGSLRKFRSGEVYWSNGPASPSYEDIPTPALPDMLRELVAFARSKL